MIYYFDVIMEHTKTQLLHMWALRNTCFCDLLCDFLAVFERVKMC